MGWPQFAYLALLFIGLGLSLERDGKPKEGRHSLIVDVIATAIVVAILWAGGFFG